MLHSFLRAGKLRRWLHRPDCPAVLLQIKCFFEKAFGVGDMSTPSSETPEDAGVGGGCASPIPSSIPSDLLASLTHAERTQTVMLARYKDNGVYFSRASTHIGNSLVRYMGQNHLQEFGSIKYIYKTGTSVKFAVQAHLPPRSPDPFARYVDFPATVRSSTISTRLDIIDPSQVICHFARLDMPSGDVAVLPLYRVRPLVHTL